jgi:hypothetical protein
LGLKVQLTTALAEPIEKITNLINDLIPKIGSWMNEHDTLTKIIGYSVGIIGGTLIVIGTVGTIVGKVTHAILSLKQAFTLLGKAMHLKQAGKFIKDLVTMRAKTILMSIANKIAAFWQWALNAAMNANPLGLIIAGVVAAIAAIWLIVKNWDKIKEFFIKLWDKIKEVFSKLWDWIKDIFSKAWEWIKKMFLNYTPYGLIIKNWDKIKEWFTALWDKVKNAFSAAWEWIKNLFLNYTPHGLIIQHWDTIVAWFSSLWDKVKEIFGTVASSALSWGADIINGIIDGITNAGQMLWDTITGIANKITGTFKNILGIHSPSVVFKDFGINITKGLTVGIDYGTPDVENVTGNLAMNAITSTGASIQTNAIPTSQIFNSQSFGGSPNVSFSPVINIYGNAASRDTQQDIVRVLRENFADMMKRYASNQERLSFNY